MSRIAVIGAGPSGLAQLRAVQSAAGQGTEVPEIVCFERQDDRGGLWKDAWRTGLDAHGEPVHSSMYRYLWSNGPKEGLDFADDTFEEHFGRQLGSYPPARRHARLHRGAGGQGRAAAARQRAQRPSEPSGRPAARCRRRWGQ